MKSRFSLKWIGFVQLQKVFKNLPGARSRGRTSVRRRPAKTVFPERIIVAVLLKNFPGRFDEQLMSQIFDESTVKILKL